MSRPAVTRLKLDVINEFKAKHGVVTKYRAENINAPWIAAAAGPSGLVVAEGYSQVLAMRKLAGKLGVESPL